MKDGLLAALSLCFDAATTVGSEVAAQASGVLKEAIATEVIRVCEFGALSLIFLTTGAFFAYKAYTFVPHENSANVWILLALIATLPSVLGVVYSIVSLLKIWLAPRVYLFDKYTQS